MSKTGRLIHTDAIDYVKESNLMQDYYVNWGAIIDKPLNLTGNKATFKQIVPVKDPEIGTITANCPVANRDVECLESAEWEMELTRMFDKAYVLDSCSFEKFKQLSSADKMDYAKNIETKLTHKIIKDMIAELTSLLTDLSADTDITSAKDIIDVLEILEQRLEDAGYTPSDFTLLVSSKVKSALKRMEIDVASILDGDGDVQRQTTFMVEHAPKTIMGDKDIICYYKPNLKYASQCERATWVAGTEVNYMGMTIYDRHLRFDYDYRPVFERATDGSVVETYLGFYINSGVIA